MILIQNPWLLTRKHDEYSFTGVEISGMVLFQWQIPLYYCTKIIISMCWSNSEIFTKQTYCIRNIIAKVFYEIVRDIRYYNRNMYALFNKLSPLSSTVSISNSGSDLCWKRLRPTGAHNSKFLWDLRAVHFLDYINTSQVCGQPYHHDIMLSLRSGLHRWFIYVISTLSVSTRPRKKRRWILHMWKHYKDIT